MLAPTRTARSSSSPWCPRPGWITSTQFLAGTTMYHLYSWLIFFLKFIFKIFNSWICRDMIRSWNFLVSPDLIPYFPFGMKKNTGTGNNDPILFCCFLHCWPDPPDPYKKFIKKYFLRKLTGTLYLSDLQGCEGNGGGTEHWQERASHFTDLLC